MVKFRHFQVLVMRPHHRPDPRPPIRRQHARRRLARRQPARKRDPLQTTTPRPQIPRRQHLKAERMHTTFLLQSRHRAQGQRKAPMVHPASSCQTCRTQRPPFQRTGIRKRQASQHLVIAQRAMSQPAVVNCPAVVNRPAAGDRPAAITHLTVMNRPAAVARPATVHRPTILDCPAAVARPTAMTRPATVVRPAAVAQVITPPKCTGHTHMATHTLSARPVGAV